MKRALPWALLGGLILFLILSLHGCGNAQAASNIQEGTGGQVTPPATGESSKPVHWTYRSTKTGEGTWDVVFEGAIDPHWVVYSQTNDPNVGPLPTLFAFDTVPGISLAGPVAETGKETIEHADPLWENAVIKKYAGGVTFTAHVQSPDAAPVATGYFEYQTCDESQCLPPDRTYFRARLALGLVETSTIPWDSLAPPPPQDTTLCHTYRMPKVDLQGPVLDCGGDKKGDLGNSFWQIFLLGFLGGLLALVTPCMFPMIPLTVSFFTKGSEDKRKGRMNAILYGAFIVLIYLSFSLPFHILGGVDPEIFNVISTNPVLNLIFFGIFIVFAVSFFGYFEITLPSSFVNKMDQNASRFGGWIGIFFMAFTLALVSFSCTGPILGSLLVGAITPDSGPMQLTVGIGGFGLAIALPFALFAMFPGWLNSLPKSGSWLNSVKVVLGFIEVALALKFYSTADMVSHWNTMPYELFLAIWVVLCACIVLYLLGFIKFPHDSPVKKISPVRWGFIGLFSAMLVYLLLGFRYDAVEKTFVAPRLLSGLAPPASYSWIHPKPPPLEDLCPAFELAQATGKPVMIDFTGYGCVNCRKMEQFVWTAPGVKTTIEEKYVLVSLYVDDREKLPKSEQGIYTTRVGTKKLIETVGDRWATLEAETFHKVSQPWYVLMSPDGRLLNHPVGTSTPEEFKAFLDCGLKAMEKLDAEAKK